MGFSVQRQRKPVAVLEWLSFFNFEFFLCVEELDGRKEKSEGGWEEENPGKRKVAETIA